MPDYGRMWLWVNLVAPFQASQLEAADHEFAITESISAVLDADFADWQAEFEVCTNDAKTGAARLDWPDFHRRGLALAQRLRAEMPDNISVFYQKPFEDPNEQFEETKEVLRDGLKTLPAQARRLRSGRQEPEWLPATILSGAQTEVGRAALDWAICERIPHAGWCRKQSQATDAGLNLKYQLHQTQSCSERFVMAHNVLASDATLIMTDGPLRGVGKIALELCRQHGKPFYLVNLSELTISAAADEIRGWLMATKITQLNVAGPSGIRKLQLYRLVFAVLDELIPWISVDEDV